MFGTETHSIPPSRDPGANSRRTGFSISAINRLARTDFRRDARLLNASVAGIVLTANPADQEMREKAAVAWETVHLMLAPRVLSDDAGFLPWTEDDAVSSKTMAELLKKRYCEIRSLARAASATSFETGADEDVSLAGKALCRLAVKLDELLEITERRLTLKLRQYVLSSDEAARLSA
jgi:hypothetical protein